MTTETTSVRLRLFKPGLVLLGAGAALYVIALWGIPWHLLRGEWNEHDRWIYLGQNAWLPFAVLGGVLVIVSRMYVWPFLRPVEMLLILAISAMLWALLFPIFARPGRGATESNCISNQRQLAIAVQIYAEEHDWTLPVRLDAVTVDPTVLKCFGNGASYARWGGYGLNAHLAGRSVREIDGVENILLTADCVTPNGLIATPADIAWRHHRGYIAAFADGHVAYLQKDLPLKPRKPQP